MQYTINQLYNHLYHNINTVYDTFKGFFGEDYVDLQLQDVEKNIKIRIEVFLEELGIKNKNTEAKENDLYEISDEDLSSIEQRFDFLKAFIYVWFPRVTVTNEYNRSVDIQDLYAQIVIKQDGRIPLENYGFKLNRATYPIDQFLCNYMHSHIEYIPKSNFTQFMSPCLGRGPIQKTIGSLKMEYDEVMWLLFCQELSMYVTVESIAGGPWKRMEIIGRRDTMTDYSGYKLYNNYITRFSPQLSTQDIKNFTVYYLNHGHLSISYRNGKYICGMPYHEYIIDISNSFINYFNNYLATDEDKLYNFYSIGILHKAILVNNVFYRAEGSNRNANVDQYRNKKVLKFKGKDILTTINDVSDNNSFTVTIISNDIAMYILNGILRTINFRFEDGKDNNTEGSQEPSSTNQRVIYL